MPVRRRRAGAAAARHREPVPARHRGAARSLRQARLLAAGGRVLHLRRDHQRPDRHAPDRGLLRPRPDRRCSAPGCWPRSASSTSSAPLLGLADRPPRPALAAVLVLRPARHGAARAERRAVRRRAWCWWRSSSSTAWTGWRPCRPPSRWCARRSAASAWAWCSPGCSPRHQFGAAFAAWGAGASRTWFDSYQPAFLVAGALGVTAAALSLSVGRRGLLRPTPSPA